MACYLVIEGIRKLTQEYFYEKLYYMLTFEKLFYIKNQNGRIVMGLFGIKFKFRKNYIGYNISGSGNRIIVVEDGQEKEMAWYRKISGLDISIIGNDNIIRVSKCKFKNCKIEIRANGTRLEFKENSRLVCGLYLSCWCGNNQYLEWGENTSVFGAKIYLHEEHSGLVVGKDCMFSADIVVWATDGHAIVGKNNGEVLNPVTRAIEVGDNCWIGHGVYLLKNTKLAEGTIVGSRSVVTREFEEKNTVLAGNPARVVKRDIMWNRKTAYVVNNN